MARLGRPLLHRSDSRALQHAGKESKWDGDGSVWSTLAGCCSCPPYNLSPSDRGSECDSTGHCDNPGVPNASPGQGTSCDLTSATRVISESNYATKGKARNPYLQAHNLVLDVRAGVIVYPQRERERRERPLLLSPGNNSAAHS